MLQKSRTIKADGLTCDLEDSVTLQDKALARSLLVEHLQVPLNHPQESIIRINSRQSGLAETDLASIQGLQYDSIMLPKVETAEDIQWLAAKISPTVHIIALIESGLALINLKEIATAHPQLSGLVFAAEDFAATMNITKTPNLLEMTYARQAVVTAVRAYGLAAIGLVCTTYKDTVTLQAECESGASYGYNGKQAIHPDQINIIHTAFSPSHAKVLWSRRVLHMSDSRGLGAFEFEGKMVDAPILRIAENILKQPEVHTEPVRGLLLGAPGVGKGTQSKRIVEKFPDISILSSGDLLRDHIHRETALGIKAKSAVARGELIDDSTMCELIISTIKERNLSAKSFFLDGFPRTIAQAQTLDSFLASDGIPLNFVANLDVPYSVIIDRIVNRWIHAPSGRTYNLSYNPPRVPGQDDVTGQPLSKRADDDVDTFKARLALYDTVTIPLRTHYQNLGVLKTFVGETSDIIWPQIESELEKSRFREDD